MHFDILIYVEKVIQLDGSIKRRLTSLKFIINGEPIDLIDPNTNDLLIERIPEKIRKELVSEGL